MTQVIAVAVQEGGMPVPRGGSAKLPEALVQSIRDHGGSCETGCDVEAVVVRSSRATGVRLTNGETVEAARAVIANVTPTQLYERLLADVIVPGAVRAAAARFRYGRAEMQIHFALSEPARWDGDERLNRTAIVHVTPGLDGVSRAVNEAQRGLLPEEATIVVGQPLTIDPSRAPEGKGLLWIQLQELPRRLDWTDELRERYADRIQSRLARHIPNLESSLVRRVALGPHDLERANVNLRHGDPYAGALQLDQNFLWRPLGVSPGHRTPVDRLWHIGASTWPGPGLGAGSGTLVARRLLEPPRARRALGRAKTLVGRQRETESEGR
jgi:phytoene dehydrogenase-like protein